MKKILLLMVATICATRIFAQSVPSNIYGQKLPVSWEAPFPNGKIISTLHPDGTITSRSISSCALCSGGGRCGVCNGTGGQYWYEMGILPCRRCGGTGKCVTCNATGYTTISSTTYNSGLTIGYDNSGKRYVLGPGGGGSNRDSRTSSSSSSKGTWYSCPCSNAPSFGNTIYHKCRNCGETHTTTSHHICKRK